ncbi:male sterility protein [Rhexocercosporidium sp. MPI-PUGE-AT-0058]|nr:male sterility protein [Rhexocercosporidium sp. MPI-PUGE-AT-0058]
MAPMLIDPPVSDPTEGRSISTCSDPLVVPSCNTSKRVRELWWLHGDPHSTRYADPRLVSLAALVRHDGAVYKSQKAFLYPATADPLTEYKSMSWNEFDTVTETIALTYAYQLENELQQANIYQQQPTVALLGVGKNIEYFCTQLALQKLGVRVLLLAESNPPNALYYLLDSCQALAVITDAKNASTNTNGIRKLDMIESLPQGSVAESEQVDKVKFQDFGDVWERHSFIIHSSGSTGMPKPIVHTNRSMMLIARMYRLFQDFEIGNWFLLFPLYHIAGISIALSNLPNGQILSFPPLSWPPSSSSIFSAWKTLSEMGHPVQCVHCAPTLIENMFEYITTDSHDFTPLTSLEILQPGGAALSDSIVKALVTAGVNVKTTYGSTEIGPPFRTIGPRDSPDCYRFRNLYPDSPFLKMEEVGEGIFECVVFKGFELAAELWQQSDAPYRTNDIFVQDPPGSGYFTMQGRKDDILVHSNGENTSAGPLQLDIQTGSRVIHKALALGHSKPCVSLLVEVHEDYDPKDTAIEEMIWEAVQAVTARYPKHSQILRSMIYVLPSGANLPITPKGNVKRKEAERIFAAEIEALYSDTFSPPSTSCQDEESLAEYLRSLFSTLSNVPTSEINDYTTLYDLGISSLTALSLRASLSNHLSRPITISTLFENPSISKLVTTLTPPPSDYGSTAESGHKPNSAETINRIITSLTSELSSWPARPQIPSYPPTSKQTVLLTGSSGSLGTSLLTTLSASPQITKIYALIRGPSAVEKLHSSLTRRGLDTSILDLKAEDGSKKIEVLNFSMRDSLLGLDIETYAMLAREVTIVLAGAWKMDFNLPVEEFEGDCIKNTMSLLRLCHAGCPKTFAFTSSISTCMGSATFSPKIPSLIIPESPIGSDPSIALSTGYAQSKYIIERITQTASRLLHLPIKLLRVGQLSGHTRTGHWSTDEMWPIMFATSFHPDVGALPLFEGKSVDWIPVDIAAGTIVEVLLQDSEGGVAGEKQDAGRGEGGNYDVHNIVNPHSISWSTLVDMLQDSRRKNGQEKLQEISMREWTKRLVALSSSTTTMSKQDKQPLPGLRLLQFFEDMAAAESGEANTKDDDVKGGENQGGGEKSKVFQTDKTRGMSSSLRECEVFNGEWVAAYLRGWREGGFLP